MRLVLVAALVLSSVSFAQTTTGEQKRRVPTTYIDMEADTDILGTPVGPDGILIEDRAPVRFKSLIRVRENFNDKLKASVNDLR